MNLRSKLENVDAANASFITPAFRASMRDIVTSRLVGSRPLPDRVVVSLHDRIDLLKTLLLLDGNVRHMVLVSPGTADEEISRRMEQLGDFCVVSDDSDSAFSISFDELTQQFTSAAETRPTNWYLSTSGTTSKPKLVGHTLTSLTRLTKASVNRPFVWGMLYDPYRFAGIQVLLQAVLSGNSLVFTRPSDELSSQLQLFASEGVNALSATPTLWRKILMTPEASQLPLRTVTLGGEIADDRILSAVAGTFPDAKIRHIYASTEAGAGFSVTDGKAGFPLSYLTDPPDGIRIKVIDNKLMIHNPLVQQRYIGENRAFVDQDGFVDTGDIVQIADDRVTFLGRANGVINVGGNKVYPEHVEHILNQVPGVKFARVFGKSSSIVGQLVLAEIVTDEASEPETVIRQLVEVAKSRLQKHERPTRYNFIDAIEHTPNGKVKR